MNLITQYGSCGLCPRNCRANRRTTGGCAGHESKGKNRIAGFCGCGDTAMAAKAALHPWEEPWISGIYGSGTVFFTGCTLRCCFCQNYRISQEGHGKELSVSKLADVFLRLQEAGAHNINLVTATHYLPSVISALDLAKHKLTIPVVYNSSGYERTEVVRLLKDYVDVWLPDFKYYSSKLSSRYSQAPDYFERAASAIGEMIRQTGEPEFVTFTQTDALSSCKLMRKGVIIRHMVLPGAKNDSIRLLHWIKENFPQGRYYLSLLSQYTPFFKSADFPEINRRVTSYEYYKVIDAAIELGLDSGFMQEKSSAKEEYTPPFDFEGIE